MKTKQFLKLALILGVICPFLSFGQTKKEAVDAYNAGAQIIKQNPSTALENLLLSIKISEQLGEEGEETKVLAEGLIPRTYLELAMKLYGEKKMNETLENLEKARETGEKYNDKTTKQRAEGIIPKLYNQMGNNEYRANNFEKAIEYYNKAISIKAESPENFLGIALSYEKQENFDKMLEYLKQTIEVANKANDRTKADDATTKAKAFLLRKGDEATKANKNEEAIEWLTRSLEFDANDATVYYALCINYNALKNWDNAITNGNIAIEKGNGSIDLGGVYYQIGTAYQGKSNSQEACKAFSNATGSFKAAAEYQMKEVIKCN